MHAEPYRGEDCPGEVTSYSGRSDLEVRGGMRASEGRRRGREGDGPTGGDGGEVINRQQSWPGTCDRIMSLYMMDM